MMVLLREWTVGETQSLMIREAGDTSIAEETTGDDRDLGLHQRSCCPLV